MTGDYRFLFYRLVKSSLMRRNLVLELFEKFCGDRAAGDFLLAKFRSDQILQGFPESGRHLRKFRTTVAGISRLVGCSRGVIPTDLLPRSLQTIRGHFLTMIPFDKSKIYFFTLLFQINFLLFCNNEMCINTQLWNRCHDLLHKLKIWLH